MLTQAELDVIEKRLSGKALDKLKLYFDVKDLLDTVKAQRELLRRARYEKGCAILESEFASEIEQALK